MSFNNELEPSNIPPSGIVSPSNGNPLIQFNIGSVNNQVLIGPSVRLNGKIKFKLNDGTAIGPNDVYISNCGVYSVLDQINIVSAQTGINLETIKSYNRYLASAFKSTLSQQKMNNSASIENLCSSTIYMSEKSIDTLHEKPFSIELPCGLLSSESIPLGMEQTGGISINLQLAQNSNVFYSDTDAGKAYAVDCEYELSGLHLTFNTRNMTDEESKMKMMSYNSIQTFYMPISNNHNSINFNIGLSRVVNMFCNFVPQEYINNFSFDSLDTGPFFDNDDEIDNVVRVQILKGGMKTPYLFDLETFNNSNHQLSTQLARNFKGCFVNNVNTLSDCYRNQANTYSNYELDPIDANQNYGIGCPYDQISNVGSNFSRDQFTLILDKTSLNPKPYLCYAFFKNVNKINFNGNGNVSIDL
jgi:hypothetical protein